MGILRDKVRPDLVRQQILAYLKARLKMATDSHGGRVSTLVDDHSNPFGYNPEEYAQMVDAVAQDRATMRVLIQLIGEFDTHLLDSILPPGPPCSK